MKKLLLIWLCVLAALAGCQRESVPAVQRHTIVWEASSSDIGNTKAYPDGYTEYSKDNSFGTFAMQTPDHWNESSRCDAYINNQQVSWVPGAGGQPGQWTTDNVYIWPQEGYLHFASYSPWETLNTLVSFPENSKANGLTITGFTLPTDMAGQEAGDYDLLVSRNVDCDYNCAAVYDNNHGNPVLDDGGSGVEITDSYGGSANYKVGVRTQFDHIMTRLVFRFQMDNTDHNYDGMKIIVSRVSISWLMDTGTYTHGSGEGTGQWLVSHPVESSVLLNNTYTAVELATAAGIANAPETTSLVDSYIALPQVLRHDDNVNPQKLTVSYYVVPTIGGYLYSEPVTPAGAKLYQVSIPEWEPGTCVTYTIKLSPVQDAIEFTGAVKSGYDWPEDSGSNWNRIDLS